MPSFLFSIYSSGRHLWIYYANAIVREWCTKSVKDSWGNVDMQSVWYCTICLRSTGRQKLHKPSWDIVKDNASARKYINQSSLVSTIKHSLPCLRLSLSNWGKIWRKLKNCTFLLSDFSVVQLHMISNCCIIERKKERKMKWGKKNKY